MPKIIPAKKIILWKIKYTKERLEKIKEDRLEKFCKQHHIPWGVTKAEMIENILLVQNDKEVKNLDVYLTWDEIAERSNGLTYVQKNFCREYCLATIHHVESWWARKYGVSLATIAKWKNDTNSKKLMEEIHGDFLEAFVEDAKAGAIRVLAHLEQIATSDNVNVEAQIKAANDYLDYAQKNKANVKGINITQQQAVQVQENKEMTEEEKQRRDQAMDILIDDEIEKRKNEREKGRNG